MITGRDEQTDVEKISIPYNVDARLGCRFVPLSKP